MTISEILTSSASDIADSVCIIDGETREIAVPDFYSELGVESDENSKRVYFKCPRFVDDVDLVDMNIYVNHMNANSVVNSYYCNDMEYDSEYVAFSWLLSRSVTAYKGTVYYIVCAKVTDSSSGDITNEWNTKIASGTVAEGLEGEYEIDDETLDIINQALTQVSTVESNAETVSESLASILTYLSTIENYVSEVQTALDSTVTNAESCAESASAASSSATAAATSEANAATSEANALESATTAEESAALVVETLENLNTVVWSLNSDDGGLDVTIYTD